MMAVGKEVSVVGEESSTNVGSKRIVDWTAVRVELPTE